MTLDQISSEQFETLLGQRIDIRDMVEETPEEGSKHTMPAFPKLPY